MQSNKTLIVLMTHVWGTRIQDMYNQFKNIHDTIVLADYAFKDEYQFPEDTLYFNKGDFELPKYYGYKIFINNFNPFFSIYDKLIEYDYIYMVEYDVEYFGKWKTLFELTDSIKDDFIIPTLYSNDKSIKKLQGTTGKKLTAKMFYLIPEEEMKEYHYIIKDELKIDKTLWSIPENYYSIGLHCFSRYSKRFLQFLYKELPHYKEFFEAVVPTLALYNGFSMYPLLNNHPELDGGFYGEKKIEISCDDSNKLFHPIKNPNYYEEWKQYKDVYSKILKTKFRNIIKIKDDNSYDDSYEEFVGIGATFFDAEGDIIKNIITYNLLKKLAANNASGEEVWNFLLEHNIINRKTKFSNQRADLIGFDYDDTLLLYLLQGCLCNFWLTYEYLIEIIDTQDKYNPGIIFNLLLTAGNMAYHNTKTCKIRTHISNGLDKILAKLNETEVGKSIIISNYNMLKSIHDYNIPDYIKILENETPIQYECSYHNDFIENHMDFLNYLDLNVLTNYKNIAL